jgi:hypothetical protein
MCPMNSGCRIGFPRLPNTSIKACDYKSRAARRCGSRHAQHRRRDPLAASRFRLLLVKMNDVPQGLGASIDHADVPADGDVTMTWWRRWQLTRESARHRVRTLAEV